MKVLFVIPALSSSSPINWVVSLIEQTAAKDKITVYSLDREPLSKTLESKLIKMGVKIIYGKGRGIVGLFFNMLELRKLTSREEYGTTVSVLFRPDLATLFCTGVRRFSSVRNSVTEEYGYSHSWPVARIVTMIHLISLKSKDKCIVMSKGMQEKLQDVGVYRTQIIPNSLDTANIDASMPVDTVKQRLRAYPDPTFIIIGSLIKRKKVVESISFFLQLLEKGYRFKVDVLGDGPQRVQIEHLLKSANPEHSSRIQLRGHVDNPIPLLERSSVFFMNSECEGVSRSLLEAAYLSKVLIVREIDGVGDLNEAGAKCYSFSSNEGALKLLESYLKDPENFTAATLPKRYYLESGAVQYEKLLGL